MWGDTMYFGRRLTTYMAIGAIALAACSKHDPLEGLKDPQGEDLPTLRGPIKIDVETPETLTLTFDESKAIVVRVSYVDGGAAVADVPLTWTVGSGAAGSTVAPGGTKTAADGRSQTTLTTGDTRSTFKVTVSAAQYQGGTVTADVDVTINGDYKGNLKVTYDYNGVIALKDVATRVHQGPINCAGVDYTVPPPTLQTLTAVDTNASVSFTGLTENITYSVTAVALGPAGLPVAYGCGIADPIVGKSSVILDLPIALKPAKLTGTYDFGSRLHLTEAIPGTAGTVIESLDAFFHDPANVLADLLIDQLNQQTGQNLESMLGAAWAAYYIIYVADPSQPLSMNPDMDGDGMLVDDALSFWVLDRLPDWVDDTLMVGGDLTTLLTNLRVGGELEITTVDANGKLAGKWAWQDFLWQWRLGVPGCTPSNACCGRELFSGEEMGLAPIGANFDGNTSAIPATDRVVYALHVNQHKLAIQYGNIVLFAISQFLLPALTGQNSFDCAIESLFGCNGSGSFVCGAAGSTSGNATTDACGCARVGQWLNGAVGAVNAAVGTSACAMAVTGGTNYLTGLVNSLTWSGTNDGYLMMTLDGDLTDDDMDLQTDLLEAVASGYLRVGGGEADFTGDVLADIERTACAASDACAANEACQMRFHPMDDCAGRQVCVPRLGQGLANQVCTGDATCASGTCLATHRCFTACADSTDCPAGTVCNANVSVPLRDDLNVQTAACQPGAAAP